MRARSKQDKDQDHFKRRLERQRVFQEAYVDQGYGVNGSIGEVDSRSTSNLLGVEPGDVLRDPKLHFVHPKLRDQ